MGKDKGIQCIPESLNTGREDKKWRGRNRKGEGRWQKMFLPVFTELPNLFTGFMPLCTFFLGQRFTWQLCCTATVGLYRQNVFLKGILESFVVM